MPRYQLPIAPKGTRTPGSGRVKGTPNRASVEARALVDQLVTDRIYQAKLRDDFRARKVHPTVENMVWAYHLGRPRQQIDISATIDVQARVAEDRRAWAAVPPDELLAMLAQSDAMIGRARALLAARCEPPTPQDVVIDQHLPEVSAETLTFCTGSDNGSYVAESQRDCSGAKLPEEQQVSTGPHAQDGDSE